MEKFFIILILFICVGFWSYTYFKINQLSIRSLEHFEDKGGGFRFGNVNIKDHYRNLLKRMMPAEDGDKKDNSTKGKNSSKEDNTDDSASSVDVSGKDEPAKTAFSEGKHGHLTRCKFFASHSEGYACPTSHPHHSGAVIGSKGHSGLMCNGEKLKSNRAKAHAEVRNGQVDKIHVTHNGQNYNSRAKVRIRGNGKGAVGRAMMGNDGTVRSIRMLHKGSGYTNSPKVEISEPDGYHYCHMCCATNESDKSTINDD